MIQTKCPSCGKQYKMPDETAGKKAKCKACGMVMQIPAKGGRPAPTEDDPLGLGGVPEKTSADLSSLYGNTGSEPTAKSAADPVGFSPDFSFTNTPRRSSGPPMKLILIGSGALVALLVVVFVGATLLGGGGKKDKNTNDAGTGLSLGGNGEIASVNPRPTDTQNNNPRNGTGGSGGTTGTKPIRLKPESPSDVKDWTIKLDPEDVGRRLKPVRFRGIEFYAPHNWEAMNINAQFGEIGADAKATDAGLLMMLAPDKGMAITVATFAPSQQPEGSWPPVVRVKKIDHTMFEDPQQWTADDQPEDLPVLAFNAEDPKRFHIRTDALEHVTYCTLFGGYPFIRMEIAPINVLSLPDTPDPTKMVRYLGYLGDTLVMIGIDAAGPSEVHLPAAEAAVRSARIMEREEAVQAAQDDAGYLRLIALDGHRSVFKSDPPPMPGKESAGGVRVRDLLEFAGEPKPPAELVSPNHRHHGILLPEGLELASKTRVAVRTQPLEDGTWLSMEVHKLTGLERRQPSPIESASGTILMRGVTQKMPADTELSELESDDFKVYRLLYNKPVSPGVRQVAYVIKDGPYLITVLGRYPADKPEVLETLETAAMSVQKLSEPVASED